MKWELLWVGLGGFTGAVSRYLVYVFFQTGAGSFPWATLWINVSGCFMLGCVSPWLESQGDSARTLALFLAMGLLGGFTTFSAFGFESFILLREGHSGLAAANAGANLFLGLFAIMIGRWLF